MSSATFFYDASERGSIGAKLIQLYTLPSQVFDIPVEPTRSIKVKIRLLNDQENLEVAELADRYSFSAKILAERIFILARAVEWIEDLPLNMPNSVKEDIRSRLGRIPTEVEEKTWVFERCQPILLQEFLNCYIELQEQQRNLLSELKKTYTESQVPSQPQTNSFQ